MVAQPRPSDFVAQRAPVTRHRRTVVRRHPSPRIDAPSFPAFFVGPIDHVGVVVPARDEADTIASCLSSIDAAATAVPVPVTIVVAADRCRDATVARAVDATTRAASVRVVEGRWGGAGAARRAGTAALLSEIDAEPAAVWLAHTDADGTVPADWLARHLAHASDGAFALAGTVQLDPERTDPDLLARFTLGYRPHGERSRHVHGANLGVRADAYLAAGGFRRASMVGEDHHIGADLAAIGVSLVHATDVVITTSSRTVGRVIGGFASALGRLEPSA